jgi:predicted acetyltransferase
MTEPAEKLSPGLEVMAAAAEQQTTLANLLELYAHDFSEFHPLEIGVNGRFGYTSLPLYWSEPGRYPLLIKMGGNLAGFVFVKRGSEVSGDLAVWDMAEFFVLRGYRRRGIGSQAAHEVWRRFPGPWEVRVMQSNVSGRHFWEYAISSFAGEAILAVSVEKAGKHGNLYSFNSEGKGRVEPA